MPRTVSLHMVELYYSNIVTLSALLMSGADPWVVSLALLVKVKYFRGLSRTTIIAVTRSACRNRPFVCLIVSTHKSE